MKIAFVVDCSAEQVEKLKACLGVFGYTCIATNNPEEIDQTGKQIGKFLMCFADAKASYRHLKDNQWREFKTLNLLFIDGTPRITEDAQKKIDEMNLNFVVQYNEKTLGQLIQKFESVKQEKDAKMVEIEFSVLDSGSDDEAA